MTHFFYMSEKALYTLAINLHIYRADRFDELVMDWLRGVQQQFPGVSVTLMGTKCDLVAAEHGEEEVERRCAEIMSKITEQEALEAGQLRERQAAEFGRTGHPVKHPLESFQRI